MTKNRMELVRQIRKWLEEDADDMLREMLHLFAQVLMGAEADELCGAERGSRSPDRVNHRNGYRSAVGSPRDLSSQVGGHWHQPGSTGRVSGPALQTR